MRIAYVNTDEVNQDLAERTASEYCAAVCILVPEGPPPDGLFDAVLYNLDEVPRDQRSALLERLRQATPHRPTAVHGYDITDEPARTLRGTASPSRNASTRPCSAACARQRYGITRPSHPTAP